jgi:23S rRNA (adenine2503-C2)-methyltransferase
MIRIVDPIILLDLSKDQLAALLAGWSEPRYRATQLWEWLYRKLVTDPAQMTNLPLALRQRLATETRIDPLETLYEQRSQDGQTVKWLFALPDGVTVETVLMLYGEGAPVENDAKAPPKKRRTVCISTQAGCAMGCVFCATGQAGLARNLTTGEIVAQVLAAARWLAREDLSGLAWPTPLSEGGQRPDRSEERLTNVVVMGMGEPLANYDRTWQALRTLTDADGFNLGARHITLSTVGLAPGIRRMTEEPLQINLAVSLHAPNDALRSKLAPINTRYPIAEVMAAVRDYVGRTHRRVTFEYALMDGINDSPALARELAVLLRGLLCHVNLIPLNPVAESPYQPSTADRAASFLAILEAHGIPATMRLRRGIDIDAGCGQLRRRLTDGATQPAQTQRPAPPGH